MYLPVLIVRKCSSTNNVSGLNEKNGSESLLVEYSTDTMKATRSTHEGNNVHVQYHMNMILRSSINSEGDPNLHCFVTHCGDFPGWQHETEARSHHNFHFTSLRLSL